MKEVESKLKKNLPGIKKNISLKNYTTFKIGGPARYFFAAKTKKDLIRAISVAKKFQLPFFILGGGSNLLVSDKGYNGLIIRILNTKYQILNTKIVAEAGTTLSQLVNATANAGLSGLEWAVGIPGTIGGAIYGNAGAFGKSMRDITKTVIVLEIKNKKPSTRAKLGAGLVPHRNEVSGAGLKIKNLKNRNCKFDYRDSVFKKNKNLIILSAIIQLKKRKRKEIQKEIQKYLNYKKTNQPLDFPSAGSVFLNPKGYSAGELIEKCGLKGKKIGKAKISEKHANFIINLGKAEARDVKKLINLVKQKVKNKFRIVLKEEIQLLDLCTLDNVS